MRNIDVMYSKKSDHWATPKKLYDFFINDLNCIDPFPFMACIDNFKNVYPNRNIFINPPFSRLKDIPTFIINNIKSNCNVIYLLIPARTDTKYFHDLLSLFPFIYFIKGRLSFNDYGSAPFPSILLIFNLNLKNCYYSFTDKNCFSLKEVLIDLERNYL